MRAGNLLITLGLVALGLLTLAVLLFLVGGGFPFVAHLVGGVVDGHFVTDHLEGR